ncbi:MAG: hypothetical protein DRP01_01935 [Archaeoglobales archaeon]|nr:MAG: hypothetical protein DRP01_01935 [Archaeoglobales archaeon]
MPLYKSGLDMWKKYQAKFDPTTIGNRFTQVQQVALDRAQEGMNTVSTVRDLVRPILDEYGIAGGQRATYLAFALALTKHVVRQKGDAATKIATGLKSYYTSAFGLDPSICDEIIQVVVGWAIPY